VIFDKMILICIKSLQAQRTISNIYHLLTGKKSIQSIQDAHIYQLQDFYGVYKNLTKKQFDQKINDLLSKELLREISKQHSICKLTAAGDDWLQNHTKECPVHYFRGLKYNDIADVFYYRLILLIQTLTNSHMHYYSFIPVIDKTSVEIWVKQVYKRVKGKEQNVLSAIYDELIKLLKIVSNREANIFVDRLTGYKHYGLSIEQLASKYKISVSEVYLLITGTTHRLLTEIIHNRMNYPFLSFMIKDLNQHPALTKSAKKTFDLWKKGLSITEIAKIRQLKESTIHDHLVEIAFYERNFPLEKYVKKENTREIMQAMKRVNNYRLKEIKDLVDENVSYFQIRLVLAVQNKLTK